MNSAFVSLFTMLAATGVIGCARILYPYYNADYVRNVWINGDRILLYCFSEKDKYNDRVNLQDSKRKVVNFTHNIVTCPLEGLPRYPEKAKKFDNIFSLNDLQGAQKEVVYCGSLSIFGVIDEVNSGEWTISTDKLSIPNGGHGGISQVATLHSDSRPLPLSDDRYLLLRRGDGLFVYDLASLAEVASWPALGSLVANAHHGLVSIRSAAWIEGGDLLIGVGDSIGGDGIYRASALGLNQVLRLRESDRLLAILPSNPIAVLVDRRLDGDKHAFAILDGSGVPKSTCDALVDTIAQPMHYHFSIVGGGKPIVYSFTGTPMLQRYTDGESGYFLLGKIETGKVVVEKFGYDGQALLGSASLK